VSVFLEPVLIEETSTLLFTVWKVTIVAALMKEENIVRFIKSQRLACYGHVNRMEDIKNVKAIMKWNPIDRRSRGRPKTRWKDVVEADLRANEDYELENKDRG
jgi:hypothetical protein